MILQVDRLSKEFGTRQLFEEVSFVLQEGQRVGLVGRNGCGKSTLLKMISGEEAIDGGSIAKMSGLRIGFLQQHLRFTEKSVLDEAVRHLPLEEGGWQPVHRAEEVLNGLGLSEEDQASSPQLLSGGQQLRLALASVLLSEPDLLLLDEPTNYLDIVAISWLTRYLRSWRRGLLLTTHDRTFLDGVCTHILGIHRGRARFYAGTTGHYYNRIEEDEERHERSVINEERRRRETEQFIDRFRYKASKAKSVQSRVKQLDRQGRMEHLSALDALSFQFSELPFPGKRLLQVRNLGFHYPDGEWLFRNLSFDLLPGERLAVVGPNGKGKSTLLRLLCGELEPSEGELKWHNEAKHGYFGQTNVDRLTAEWSVEDAIGNAAPELTKSAVRSICGAMLFSGDDANKQIKLLSGGERCRVLLGRLLVAPSHLLLLDEPTHHLDLESSEALLQAIESFDGAVVLVSHSEGVVERIAEKLIVFDSGGATLREEGYSEFLERLGWESSKIGSNSARGASAVNDRKEQRRLRAQRIEERSRLLKPLRREISRQEKVIAETEREISRLHQELIHASAEGIGERVEELSKALALQETKNQQGFDAWAAAGEEVECLELLYIEDSAPAS